MSRQNKFGFAGILILLLGGPAFAAEKSTATQLIELAKTKSPALKDAIANTLDTKELKDGTAWIGYGADFFFAIEATSKPGLWIDGAAGPQMQSLAGTELWYAAARIEPVGRLHSFYYLINGGENSVAGWICLRLDLCPTSNPEFQQGRFRRSCFTPAKSTTA